MSTALVLSAGGMYGAYQAGVWGELAPAFNPDIVVGASVGSLNGWHIACGCGPTHLAERWLGLGELARIRWRLRMNLCHGILDASALEEEVQSMCRCSNPVRRFGVVLTHIPSLRPTLFQTPQVSWHHIAASCSVPLFLRQHRIDGHWYSDGGLVDPLPLNAAIAMGATRIVAVNVMNHRPLPIRLAVGAMRRLTHYSNRVPDGVQVVEVSPDSALGPVRDSVYWQRDKIAALIERGRRDAIKILPKLTEFV
jgi:NTE family protein